MVSRKLTRSVVISIAGLFLLAGGAAHPVECGKTSCCCMPETTDNLAFQQGHCGCDCGQFEETQVPDQTATIQAVTDSKPVQTKFDYIVDTKNDLFENVSICFSFQEKPTHSPPFVPDNKYTPLLC